MHGNPGIGRRYGWCKKPRPKEVLVNATWGMGARAIALAGLLTGALIGGCEVDDGSMIVSYVDAAGRSCTVDVDDITGIASCDVDAATLITCEADQEPAMVIGSDHDFETGVWTLRSCAGCVDRAERTTYLGLGDTCAPVTCETDADCVYERYTCEEDGVCRDRD